MQSQETKGFLSKKIFNSAVKSANVKGPEKWLGYFFSPAFIYISYFCVGVNYINMYWTDVLKLGGFAGGAFLALLPVVSKIIDVITNFVMGQIIDHTRTAQGKVRPWILLSAPFVAIAGILLYTVPQAGQLVQAIWVGISYNLFFAFAFTIYNMSQTLLIPLSTRNVKQRDTLAMFLSMGQSMLPGALVSLVFPAIALPWLGVSAQRWGLIMCIISIICFPAILLQYYFTKERVMEEGATRDEKTVSIWVQLKTCFHDKYWLLYFGIVLVHNLQTYMYSFSQNYYCNWVLGTYNDGITLTLLNAIGMAPMGFGVFILWPVVRKLGKRMTYFVGMLLASVSMIPIILMPTSFPVVIVSMFFKAFGTLPTYLFLSMLADAMDHIEWKNGFRCDGISATFNTVVITISQGIMLSIFNAGLSSTGYVAPVELADGTVQTVTQSAATQHFIVICFAAIPMVAYLIGAIFAWFFKIDKIAPQMQTDLIQRQKDAAAARGEVYMTPEELAAIEQEKNDAIAEQNRIEELKALCAKKGLSFEEEEAKYQAKLAQQKAKQEAKEAAQKAKQEAKAAKKAKS